MINVTNTQAYIIISDIDDTLKKTDSLLPALAVYQFLLKPDEQYLGLKNLINDLNIQRFNSKIFYVSNSYQDIFKGSDWLLKNNFPKGDVFQRKNAKEFVLAKKYIDPKEHKVKTLTEIYEVNESVFKSEELLLFGDNGYDDKEIYQEFLLEYNIKNAKVLIRDVRGDSFAVIVPFQNSMNILKPTVVGNNNEVYVFRSETQFWFDLNYDFLVQKTNLLTWWSWYIGWHRRNIYSTGLSQLIFNKYQRLVCPTEENEGNKPCNNKLKNQITQLLAQDQRPLF